MEERAPSGRVRDPIAKRMGWLITLAPVATVIGLVAAPQVVFVVDLVCASWLPPPLLHPVRHVCYEVSLWGSGLAVWLAARRLGWLSGPFFAAALVASPVLVESVAMLGMGRVSAGLATWIGLTTRLLIGAAAVSVAILSARSPIPKARETDGLNHRGAL
ncbi:hypothetical protein ACFL6C_11485 [Myxococcota bacterium]